MKYAQEIMKCDNPKIWSWQNKYVQEQIINYGGGKSIFYLELIRMSC